MEPIIAASHVYIRYLLGDFRDIELKKRVAGSKSQARTACGKPLVGGRWFFHAGKR